MSASASTNRIQNKRPHTPSAEICRISSSSGVSSTAGERRAGPSLDRRPQPAARPGCGPEHAHTAVQSAQGELIEHTCIYTYGSRILTAASPVRLKLALKTGRAPPLSVCDMCLRWKLVSRRVQIRLFERILIRMQRGPQNMQKRKVC